MKPSFRQACGIPAVIMALLGVIGAAGATPAGEEFRIAVTRHLRSFLTEGGQEALWRSEYVLPWLPSRDIPSGLLADIVVERDFLSHYEKFGMVDANAEEARAFLDYFLKCRVRPEALPEGHQAFDSLYPVLAEDSSTWVVPLLALDIDYDRLASRLEEKVAGGRGGYLEGKNFFCVTARLPDSLPDTIQLDFRKEMLIGNSRQPVARVEVLVSGRTFATDFPGTITIANPPRTGLIVCNFHHRDGVTRSGYLRID